MGVVVKAEEHGSVRCRLFNGSNDSFSFVLGRYTIQRLLLYWHRHFRFFSQTVPIPFLPFLLGGPRICRGQNHPRLCLKTIWTFITHPRLYPSSARALGPNVKMGQGHKLLGPTIAAQNPAVQSLGRRGGFCWCQAFITVRLALPFINVGVSSST